MKKKRSLWISLFSVIAVAVIALSATLAAGWSPKLGLDLDGGLSVVYQTHRPVDSAQLATIVTILNDRVGAGTTGATVASQGKNEISVSIPGEKNSQQVLATLGNTAQLFFRPALCYAPSLSLGKGKPPSTGPLPTTCTSGTELTAANLQVTPTSSNINGYTNNTNSPRTPSSLTHPSTPSTSDNKDATVLLPGVARQPGPAPLPPRAGRHDRHGGQVGQCRSCNRAVVGGPQPHRPRAPTSGTHWPSSTSTPSSGSTSTAR